MSKFKIPPAQYIDSDKTLQSFYNEVKDADMIGVDTESNSLHAYHERVCLIQISTRTKDYLIDPFEIEDMSPLGKIMADSSCQKIFHAAEYDLMCLRRDFGFEIVNLFDTMVAARICGYKEFGLGNLLKQFFGVKIDKSHQRDDWGKRPLQKSSLLYAQMDSHYLPRLRDILYNELVSTGHFAEAEDMFDYLLAHEIRHDGRSFDPDGFWKLGIPKRLSEGEMAILRELYLMREVIAEARNKPPFKILSNNMLIALAQAAPTRKQDLRRVNGMSPAQIRRYGDDVLDAIWRGRKADLPEQPTNRPPPSDISDRYIALHTWRKERAMKRGVESDVIIPKQTLWSLAHKVPSTLAELEGIEGIGPWKLEAYGEEILQVIERHENGNGKHGNGA